MGFVSPTSADGIVLHLGSIEVAGSSTSPLYIETPALSLADGNVEAKKNNLWQAKWPDRRTD